MTAWKAFLHVFWHCSFVLSLWEWFQASADRVTGDRTWSVGHGFVLYGVDLPECSVGVLRRLHFVSVTLKKHIWRNRWDIVFRGRISPWQSVLEAVKSDVKLHIEADFHRLSGAVFAGRWSRCFRIVRVVHWLYCKLFQYLLVGC